MFMSLQQENNMVTNTPEASSGFDTSDDEDFEAAENIPPLQIDWLDLSSVGCDSELIGISALPGCKFMHINRTLQEDIEFLVQKGIQEIYVLCTQGEMIRCRVPNVFENYKNSGILSHHYPMNDFKEPNINQCLELVQKLKDSITKERKTIIHCVAGVGRSCLGMLLLDLNPSLLEDEVIQKLKHLRGPNAIQTVKQFNLIHEYRDIKSKFYAEAITEPPFRSVSR